MMDYMDDSIEARIEHVKQKIRDATRDAVTTSSWEPLTPAAEKVVDQNPDFSFQLGVELFGSGVSSAEKSVQHKLEVIEKDLKQVIEQINAANNISGPSATANDDHGDETKMEIRRSPEQLEAESKVLRVKLRFLKECSKARELLDESATLYTEALAPKQAIDLQRATELHAQANQYLTQAKAFLDGAEESTKNDELLAPARKIYDSVHTTHIRQSADLLQKATTVWHECISYSVGKISVADPVQLNISYNVLQLMDEHSTLGATLRKFTGSIYDDIVGPLIDGHRIGQPLISSVTISESSLGNLTNPSPTNAHHLHWTVEPSSSSKGKAADIASWKQTLESIAKVTEFLSSYVALGRDDLCDFLKVRLMGKPSAIPASLNLNELGIETPRLGDDTGLLIEPLIEALEDTCIPKFVAPNELCNLQVMSRELEGYLTAFTNALSSQKLLPNGHEPNRLMAVAESFTYNYVERRRVRLLADTRDMLLKNDYHNTTQVGEEIIEDAVEAAVGLVDGLAAFKLHRSSVSDTAFKLMASCRSIMEEAVLIPVFPPSDPLSSLAAGLYRAAREGLSLYRAIIPVSYAKEIANVPRTAAVLHNDCVYLAHHCHTLGLEFKPRFPPAEPDDAKGQLLRQTCMFVDMVPLFREIADRSLGEMLDMQAQQVSSLVGERTQLLGQALTSNEDLAEWSDAETALEAGLYHLRHLAETWRPILATDILNRSMCFLADVMLNIFLDQLAKANDISTTASQFVNTLFLKAIEDLSMLMNPSRSRVWDRFIAIGKFMDMSIADIQVALSDGVFRNVTAPELSKLVTACFDNSPKRKHLLQSLSSSNQRVG